MDIVYLTSRLGAARFPFPGSIALLRAYRKRLCAVCSGCDARPQALVAFASRLFDECIDNPNGPFYHQKEEGTLCFGGVQNLRENQKGDPH